MDSHIFADSSSIHDTLWEKNTALICWWQYAHVTKPVPAQHKQ